MKHSAIFSAIVVLLAVSCATAPTPTVALTATAPITPANTTAPTSTVTPTGTPTATAIPRPLTLRDYADRLGFKIGASITKELVDEYDRTVTREMHQKYSEIISSSFNLGVVQNAVGWTTGCEPKRGQININCRRFGSVPVKGR